jgi:tetratricopeptide (TPR) repeat protein
MNILCKRRLPAVLLILLAGIIAYSNTFHVPFVLDDAKSITQNPVIRNLTNFYPNGTGYEFVPNRSFAYLTFALNYHFGGYNLFGYHAVNLLIHLLAALLVYALLSLTFSTPYFQGQASGAGSGSGSGATSTSTSTSTFFSSLFTPHTFIPLFAALLFVIHPIQTQAVTYVVQRIASLATMFYLLSIVLYVQARLRLEARGSGAGSGSGSGGSGPSTLGQRQKSFRLAPVMLMAGSVLSAVLAMKTKEIAFTLPLAIVLYEVFFFRGHWKRRLLFLLPLLATLPIVPLSVLHAAGDIQSHAGNLGSNVGLQLRVGTSISRLDYLFTQFRVIVTYLRLLVLPVNQNLDYDYPVYKTFFTPAVFLSFLFLAALFALAVYLFWRTRSDRQVQAEGKPGSAEKQGKALSSESQPQPQPVFSSTCFRLVSFGILWFFLTLAVESSLIPIVDVIAEHRLYLPGFGAATAFAAASWIVAEKFSRPGFGKILLTVSVLVVLGLGFATYQRNHVWGNAIRLWQDAVKKSPDKGRPINNLGVALEKAGRRSEAFKTLSRAIEIDPNYAQSYYNLADLYVVSGRPDEALPLLQAAIRLKPDFRDAYVDMGAALMRGGHFSEAATFLERNLNWVGNIPEARFYLGSAYAFLGKRQAALKELEFVSRHDAQLAASLAGLLGINSSHGATHEGP